MTLDKPTSPGTYKVRTFRASKRPLEFLAVVHRVSGELYLRSEFAAPDADGMPIRFISSPWEYERVGP